MKTTKHFALMVLLVLGVTLCASTPARAQFSASDGPLYCAVGQTDPDFGASGQWTFVPGKGPFGASVDEWGNHYYGFGGTLSVACWDLTPRAVYSAGDQKSKAGKDGSVSFVWKHSGATYFVPAGADFADGEWLVWVQVSRLNGDKTSIVVLHP